MQKLIGITIILAIIFMIVIIFYLYILQIKLKKLAENNKVSNDDALMVRYNYVINLRKLDAFTKQIITSSIDNKLITYIKDYNDKIKNSIYSAENYDKTINFENELLYKTEIINFDVIFYAYNHFFNTLDDEYYEIINNKELFHKEIKHKEKSFKKRINSFRKKGLNIIKEKDNSTKYYEDIEIIKNSYKEYINKLNPIFTILFINHAIDVINEKDNID